ncbi:DUF4235 domain-containing protein [Streptomyces sp. CB01881]|nr:hypothetical protein C2142_37095 [Streptomyces sp. CB01881]TYC69813.1 DUF4235 domain-containing protein [Streptomyces sp. CB01881]
MATITHRPAALLVGALGGGPAVAVVRRAWRIVGHEETAKERHTWRRGLLAAALRGAVFALLKAALGRGAGIGKIRPASSPPTTPSCRIR